MGKHVFSFGGGVQSTAALVLARRGVIAVDLFIFANVGADSENPKTLAYLDEVAKPYAQQNGIALTETAKRGKTVYQEAARQNLRSVVIPAFRGNGGQAHRNCTTDWKIKPVDRYIKSIWPGEQVKVGLGITIDEWKRLRDTDYRDTEGKRVLGFSRARWYPLFELRLTRGDCIALIESEGLPVPPKSSCFFCPFMRRAEWQALRDDQPELWASAVRLENALNGKGLPGRYSISQAKIPLDEAFKPSTHRQSDMFQDESDSGCVTGYCHT